MTQLQPSSGFRTVNCGLCELRVLIASNHSKGAVEQPTLPCAAVKTFDMWPVCSGQLMQSSGSQGELIDCWDRIALRLWSSESGPSWSPGSCSSQLPDLLWKLPAGSDTALQVSSCSAAAQVPLAVRPVLVSVQGSTELNLHVPRLVAILRGSSGC